MDWKNSSATRALLITLALATPGPVLTAQAKWPSIQSVAQSPLLLRPRTVSASTLARRIMGPTSRAALIGGGIGLATSVLAVVLYVEGTDPGNYTGAGRVVLGATALGAIIGAAIGTGSEP